MNPSVPTCLMLVLAALLATGCATRSEEPETPPDPNFKQFMTGSRLPYKGRGGPDSVKTVSRESMADEMNSHQMPHRQGN